MHFTVKTKTLDKDNFRQEKKQKHCYKNDSLKYFE